MIKLQKPLFYLNQFALRFEIGPVEIPIWLDAERLNQNSEYFGVALARASLLFESTFCRDSHLTVILQEFSDGRQKIRPSHPVLRLLKSSIEGDVHYEKRRDVYREDLVLRKDHWSRATFQISRSGMEHRKILDRMLYSDLGGDIQGECYFVGPESGIVYHLYSDQGLDLVASRKESLQPIYKMHKELLLNYDRAAMDRNFDEE